METNNQFCVTFIRDNMIQKIENFEGQFHLMFKFFYN